MMLQQSICDWDNLMLAYQNASHGKRGKASVAAFETLLGDHLIDIQGVPVG